MILAAVLLLSSTCKQLLDHDWSSPVVTNMTNGELIDSHDSVGRCQHDKMSMDYTIKWTRASSYVDSVLVFRLMQFLVDHNLGVEFINSEKKAWPK